MIFSSRSLDNIGELIESYYEKVRNDNPELELGEFCLSVPDKFDNHQTRRTIVTIDDNVYQLLKEFEHDLDEFQISKLKMKKHFYPNTERHEVPSLYISLPKNISLTACQNHLIERMTSLRGYGIWKKENYKIHIPRSDRLKDTHNGVAFIYFNQLEETRLDDIVLSRLFINNTKWPESNLEVHCYWSKTKEFFDKQKQKEAEGTSKTESKPAEDASVWDLKKGKHH
jgi:hypothetical protein